MATRQTQTLARFMMAPSVIVLFVWMIVPLVLTSGSRSSATTCSTPIATGFVWFRNYSYFLTDPAFVQAITNTLILVVGVLVITVVGGILLALLLDQPIWGQGIVRLLVIAPFFVMPTVSALVWKNMMMHPAYGIFAWIATSLGPATGRLAQRLSAAVGDPHHVAWEWLPFATLILLTALQSLDEDQKEASEMDGANFVNRFIYIILPHLARAITVVILIETIFLLVDLRRDLRHHAGRPRLCLHQPAVPRLRAGTAQLRRGRRLRRRRRRRHPRQHRCDLPDPHRRQEPGRVRTYDMARAATTSTQDHRRPSPPGPSA